MKKLYFAPRIRAVVLRSRDLLNDSFSYKEVDAGDGGFEEL